ncbi:CLUMA_CG015626, isoform A [Clunio marinus]|uniref:CLUMA_CG015626, isoform A n=1 Tax=Clunio marinus TaxID=568069 RepID=A0A1J1INS4_9DIPT|nr:CLUMA_CG015626, isoform A [Clunio marinus]
MFILIFSIWLNICNVMICKFLTSTIEVRTNPKKATKEKSFVSLVYSITQKRARQISLLHHALTLILLEKHTFPRASAFCCLLIVVCLRLYKLKNILKLLGFIHRNLY